ncbi:hypothetical protein GUJ93_ZPchr0012g19972 [Zizania palustris]|uniref:Uncharacterized protein n=1 Tax=Zizania palustris TaxID=103762 RepID=A0A8J5WIQ2_ZIZPA|nr:hypothetical protein GUJ93_ZPchr0012g19972 [Zizania palustris]
MCCAPCSSLRLICPPHRVRASLRRAPASVCLSSSPEAVGVGCRWVRDARGQGMARVCAALQRAREPEVRVSVVQRGRSPEIEGALLDGGLPSCAGATASPSQLHSPTTDRDNRIDPFSSTGLRAV